MNLPISPYVLRDLIAREKDYREAERYLFGFTKASWSLIEPGIEFKDNWHLHHICEHLEAVSTGEIENLLINIPPGCMKSILVSVSWPAWEWIENPQLRYLGASYGEDLAIRDAQKCRDVIMSDWYQARWDKVQVRKGADNKKKYELTSGGWRIATSVGGRATGEHPDRKIVDDPHNAKQAESDVERENGLIWFDRTLSTRGESRHARTVVVMQRLHERDLSGHILDDLRDDYVHLCIPMEYEKKTTKVTVLGWHDPRKNDGDLLWESMFNAKSIKKLKRTLGSYGAAGQLQQRPSPEGGGILLIDHFQLWPTKAGLPALDYVIQSYDTAFSDEKDAQKTKTNPDPSACSVWGFFEHMGQRCAILLDYWSEYLSYPKLRTKVLDDWTAVYGRDIKKARKGRRADRILVERKASGHSLLQDLSLANIPAVPFDPKTNSKLQRAHQAAPILETDVLYIMESQKDPGQYISWARPLINQIEKFPNDAHDDGVDTFTQLVIYARDTGWLELDYAEDDEDTEKDYGKEKPVNPYAA